MSFGNVLLSGDDQYSKGQFDEAIKYYTEAANQGYVEGMEKLLKTCVEQGRKYSDDLDEKAMEYWGMASMTLRGIMQHGEIAQEIKDSSYTYYNEIMYGIANEYFWKDKYEEALKACNKLNAKNDVIVETIKTYCDLHILVEICRKLVGDIEGGEDKVFPFVNDGGLQDCFKRFGILDKLTEQECKKLAKQTPQGKKVTFSWILYNLSCVYLSGRSGNLLIVTQDEDKALHYWKLRMLVDPSNLGYDIPQEIKNFFEARLKEKNEKPAAISKTEQKSNLISTPAKRKITINRPKKLMCGLLKVKISMDEVERAVLKNGESATLELDGNQHIIYCIAKALDGTVYESMGYIPADSKAHTIEIDVNKRSLFMDGTTEINKIKEIKTAWMNTSFEVKEFLWIVEQLFTPESMHKVGDISILEKYDQVRITSVGYKKLMLSAKYWNKQEGKDSYVDIPIPYDNSKLELKNSYETERLEDMLNERLKGLPHIALKGIYYRLIQ